VSATDQPNTVKPETAPADGAKEVKAPETAAKKPDSKLHNVAFDPTAASLWKRLLYGESPTDAVPLVQTTLLEPVAAPGSHDVGAPEKKPKIEKAAEHIDATGKVAKLSNGDVTAASTTGDKTFFANHVDGSQTFTLKGADGQIRSKAMQFMENGQRAFGYDLMGANSQLLASSHIASFDGSSSRVMETKSLGSNIMQSLESSDVLMRSIAGHTTPGELLTSKTGAGFTLNQGSYIMDTDGSVRVTTQNGVYVLDALHALKVHDRTTGQLRDLTLEEKALAQFKAEADGGITLGGLHVSRGNKTITDALGHEVTIDANGRVKAVEKDPAGRSLLTAAVDRAKSVVTDVRTGAQYVVDFAKNAYLALNAAGQPLFSFDAVAERFVAGDPNHPDVVFAREGTELWNHTKIDKNGQITLPDGTPLTGPGSSAYQQVQQDASARCATAAALLSQASGSKDASFLQLISSQIAEVGSMIPACAAVGNSQAEQQTSNAFVALQLAYSRISGSESDA
jgi:hypothetical protein